MLIRSASEADQDRIVRLVRAARINPVDLHWANFLVAVDDQTGTIAGVGQIKAHEDGSRELASIVVVPEFQGQGIARRIIQRLLASSRETLFVSCPSHLVPMYAKFGFREIDETEMTPYFRRLRRALGAVSSLSGRDLSVTVMKRDGDA